MGRRLRSGARRSRLLPALIAAEAVAALVLALVLAAGAAGPAASVDRAEQRANRSLASALGLTDLALWPGASYSRHPSQADGFAPFSDHPAAFEHSPAGSVVPPPRPLETWARPAGAGRPP